MPSTQRLKVQLARRLCRRPDLRLVPQPIDKRIRPLVASPVIREHAPRDTEQPRERVHRYLLPPPPGDQEHVGDHVLSLTRRHAAANERDLLETRIVAHIYEACADAIFNKRSVRQSPGRLPQQTKRCSTPLELANRLLRTAVGVTAAAIPPVGHRDCLAAQAGELTDCRCFEVGRWPDGTSCVNP